MKYIIIFLIVSASAGFCQPPLIDSMFVDEAKSELQLHGDFGWAKGGVWVDSVSLSIVGWSDSLVTATIPSTGKGSAGLVIVGGRGYRSIPKLLTEWVINANYSKSAFSNYYLEYIMEEWSIIYRCDIESKLKAINASNNISISINESEGYDHHVQSYDPVTKQSNNKDEGGSSIETASGRIDINNLTVQLDAYDMFQSSGGYVGGFGLIHPLVILDSELLPQSGFIYTNVNTGFSGYFSWADAQHSPPKVFFPPSSNTINLRQKPTLLKPDSGAVALATNGNILSWDSLRNFTTYHVQVFNDSILSLKFIDTIISTTDFILPPLAKNRKYYWRISGANSEGESVRSNLWTFTTGVKADVMGVNLSDKILSYPNPTTSSITLQDLPENTISIHIVNVLGQTIAEFKPSINFDLKRFQSGIYYLQIITSKSIVIQKIIKE